MGDGTVTVDLDDLLQPAALADPYTIYEQLRASDPVHWNPRLDAWMILRYDDVLAALNDPKRLSSDRTTAFMGHLSPEDSERLRFFSEMRQRMLLYTDPPTHTRLRRPVQHALSTRAVRQLRGQIQQVADEQIDKVIASGRMDGIADLGYPLPIVINSSLVGVPPPDRDKVKNWTADFIEAINAGGAGVSTEALEHGQDAVVAMTEYFGDLARRRQAEPRDDAVSRLVHGEDGRLGDEDLAATCIVLLFAGLETALNLIGNGLLALLRHPDQLELLRADPSLLPGAVEELLRYDGPLQMVGRMATEDITLRSRRIAKGDKVLVMLSAANRDPEQFEEPHRLDITRTDNRHVAFSHGTHYCPGAELSRIEGEIALGTVLRRLADLRLGDEALEWQPNLSFRGLRRLPLRFQPAA
jgi:pimeloyl-[acyl-carrier protein] synthase